MCRCTFVVLSVEEDQRVWIRPYIPGYDGSLHHQRPAHVVGRSSVMRKCRTANSEESNRHQDSPQLTHMPPRELGFSLIQSASEYKTGLPGSTDTLERSEDSAI